MKVSRQLKIKVTAKTMRVCRLADFPMSKCTSEISGVARLIQDHLSPNMTIWNYDACAIAFRLKNVILFAEMDPYKDL